MTPTIPTRSILRATLVASLVLAPWALSVSQASAQGAPGAPRVEGHRGHRGHCGPRGHRRHEEMRQLLEQLDLTDNQRAQIRAIRESTRQQARELRGQGRSPQTRAAKRALHREARRLIREVLTPAQRQQLEALRAQKRAQHLTRRVERMTAHLNLSAAQAAEIRRILEQTQAQRQALEEADAHPEEMRARHQALREQTWQAIDAVLTPQQRQLAAQHRERRGHRRGPHGRHGGER